MSKPTGQAFPRLVATDMDNGLFWQSFEEHQTGDIITHEGRKYRVLYSWTWIEAYGLYSAELEPAEIGSEQ